MKRCLSFRITFSVHLTHRPKSDFLGREEMNLKAEEKLGGGSKLLELETFPVFLEFLAYGTSLDTELSIKKKNDLRQKVLMKRNAGNWGELYTAVGLRLLNLF